MQMNGYDLEVAERPHRGKTKLYHNQPLFDRPFTKTSENLKTYRNTVRYDRIVLTGHRATLAFGALTSPFQFQCAEDKFYHEMNQYSPWHLCFVIKNSFIAINIGDAEFQLKREHIDIRRGVIYDLKSTFDVAIYIFLKNNLEEYIQQPPTMPLQTRGTC